MMLAEVFKSFRPTFTSTVVPSLLVLFFTNLGMWQTRRGAEKAQIEYQFETAGNLPLTEAILQHSRFAHIVVSGHYETKRHILLDNQVWHGGAGVHVFTPFRTLDRTVILVNRGWLPLTADRKIMPDIPTPEHETVLKGILNVFPVPGRILGSADLLGSDNWPQLVTYLNHADISVSLDAPLAEWIVQLSASDQTGFDGRDWKPVFLTSLKHKGYAFQWFSLAGISIVLWLFNGYRRPKGNSK